MAAELFINDEGIQEIIIEGDLGAEDFAKLKELGMAADDEQRQRGVPVLTLVNIDRMGRLDMSIILEVIKLLGDQTYDKTAFYGDYKTDSTVLARLIKDVSTVGSKRVRSFASRNQALEWLKT